MKYSIRTKGETHTLEVSEDKTICTLTLAKSHDIVTKGEDPNEIAFKIASSYRNCIGKSAVAKDLLKLIRQDLVERSGRKPDKDGD